MFSSLFKGLSSFFGPSAQDPTPPMSVQKSLLHKQLLQQQNSSVPISTPSDTYEPTGAGHGYDPHHVSNNSNKTYTQGLYHHSNGLKQQHREPVGGVRKERRRNPILDLNNLVRTNARENEKKPSAGTASKRQHGSSRRDISPDYQQPPKVRKVEAPSSIDLTSETTTAPQYTRRVESLRVDSSEKQSIPEYHEQSNNLTQKSLFRTQPQRSFIRTYPSNQKNDNSVVEIVDVDDEPPKPKLRPDFFSTSTSSLPSNPLENPFGTSSMVPRDPAEPPNHSTLQNSNFQPDLKLADKPQPVISTTNPWRPTPQQNPNTSTTPRTTNINSVLEKSSTVKSRFFPTGGAGNFPKIKLKEYKILSWDGHLE
ncbi:hypothetical protein HK098_001549, partial [Nowakowskiella sp. JEL0407]